MEKALKIKYGKELDAVKKGIVDGTLGYMIQDPRRFNPYCTLYEKKAYHAGYDMSQDAKFVKIQKTSELFGQDVLLLKHAVEAELIVPANWAIVYHYEAQRYHTDKIT